MNARIGFIIGAVVGLLAGGGATSLYKEHRLHEALQEQAAASKTYGERALFLESTYVIGDDIGTLRALRRGDVTNVLAYKEQSLVSEIEKLVSDYPKLALSDPSTVRMLKLVAEYNDQYPLHSGNTNTDRKVKHILESLGTKP